MKIFRNQQIKEIDKFTIENEPVASVDLMERAADQLLRWYIRSFDRSRRIIIFAGPGNNGGDGIALARLLSANRFNAEVFFVKISGKTSDDWNQNYHRLEKETSVIFNTIENIGQFPFAGSDDVIIDAIFGSGLTRPVEGLAAQVIKKINQTGSIVISVDIPSGLFGENNSANDPETIICADFTLSFEFPKLCFMFGENARFVGDWSVLPIGLSRNAIMNTNTPYFFLEDNYISPMLKKRKKFDHKGKYGHGLLIAGSYGKMGAAVLGAKAALRTGIGLVTCHVPGCGYQIIQTSLPEAMVSVDQNEMYSSEAEAVDRYDAIGIGPGIGNFFIIFL
jgi:NAD(P)H-hydrate epimerase